MTDVAKLQLIEARHNGIMKEEEQKELDELLVQDPSFSSELEDYQVLLDGFDALALEAFEKDLHCYEAKHQQEEKIVSISPKGKTRKLNLGRLVSMAAAVAIFIFVPITYYNTISGPDTFDQLYETPVAFIVRGEASEEKEQEYNLALSIYNKGDYSESIKKLNAFIDNYGEQEYEAIFYLASAQLAIGDYKASSMNFEHVAENAEDSAFYRQQAEWYLVLAQYKLDNTTVAIKLAKRIKLNTKHNYYDKASKFLEEVK